MVVFCASDLLVAKGRSVMSKPLWERKAPLGALVKLVTTSVLNVSYVEGAGEQMYQSALTIELEEIVAKELEARYKPSVRSESWLKIKRPGAVPAKRFKYASR